MADIWMDVDTAIAEAPINKAQLIDDTDFKSIEASVVYNAAGLALKWNFVTTAGAYTQTAVTPTDTAGNYDWVNQGNGFYSIEIPASGGASINNDTEGFGWFSGVATGVLPWVGPIIGFRAAGLNDKLIDSAYSTTRALAGTALPDAAAEAAGGLYTRGTGAGQINQANNGNIDSNTVRVGGTSQTAGDIIGDTNDIQARLPAALTSNGNLKASFVELITTTLTEGAAGRLKAALTTFFDVASPVLTTASVNQTGDAYARLGAPAGASVSADILAIDNFVDDIESRLGTPSDLGGGATIAANLVDIEGQTDDIGSAGAGLTNIPWNAAWDAEVQSEVDDALVARNLDKLIIVSGTADSGSTTTMVDAARTEGDADYWKGRMILFTSGTISGQCAIITDFNAGTDTFTLAPALTQAVGTQTYVILPGISVWDDTLAEHLASGTTGNALNSAGSAGDPWATALPGAYGAGTAGKIIGDNVNATISSRASQASLDTVDDFLDTEVAAILADTNELQTDWANGGRLDLLVDAILEDTGTTLQAEVDGIQADTEDIQTRLPAALVGGRIDASVGAMASAVLTATAIAADAITDAKVASDVTIASVTGSVGSVTAGVTIANNGLDSGALTAAAKNAISDAILDRNMTTGTDSGSETVRTVRQALRILRNKVSISAGTLTVTKEDDTTTSWTGAVTTAAGNPISAVDPTS